ncbi:MAG: ribonuclease P protein component [Humibacillus sp.]|nr:ribonuclease P protein component [Humibacillus sp.]MDN5778415.1 ribonuclease P protein component [Humibacillus sp.]
MLPARHRLRERAEFTSVVRGAGARRAGGRLMVVHANRLTARAALPPRVGFVVSKAVGNAVVRGRTKRRLRAIAATRLSVIPDGLDIVVRANPSAAQADFHELSDAFGRALGKVCGP